MNKRLEEAAKVLQCGNSIEEIKSRLIEIFPEIDSGRKTSDDLIQEIILGESSLRELDGKIIREVRVVNVDIPSPIEPGTWLWESRQEYPNQTIERNIRGVSEKFKGEEIDIYAGIRGIKEELGIDIVESQIKFLSLELADNPASAYQGIISKTWLYKLKARIQVSDYLPEYREIGEKKTTVFIWKSQFE